MTGPLKQQGRGLAASWRTRWGHDLDAPGARMQAWIDAMLVDHGFLRAGWTNFHKIDDGVFRSNQPSPRRIRRLAAMGFKSILNVRGETKVGSYVLERDAAAQAGLTLVDHKLFSRGLPHPADVHAMDEIFRTIEKPFLIHCKSGADRAGLAAALYVLLAKGGTPDEAMAQLSFKYLHIKAADTGVLDHFLATYAAYDAATPTPFLTWIDTVYDRDAVKADFKANKAARFLVNRILRRE